MRFFISYFTVYFSILKSTVSSTFVNDAHLVYKTKLKNAFMNKIFFGKNKNV